MGLAPSFAAFTLTHIFLLRSLGGTADNVRVLGDDVIIADPMVESRYLSWLERNAVPVSWNKSLKQDTKCEFAGRVVDSFGIWPVYRASPIDIHGDPLGYIRQYGYRALHLLPRWLQRIVAPIMDLPPLTLREPNWDKLGELYARGLDPSFFIPVRKFPGNEGLVKSLPSVKALHLHELESDLPHNEGVGPVGTQERISNPVLAVDHVNVNLRDHFQSEFIEELMKSLVFLTGSDPDRGVEPRVPLSYLRKVSSRVKALLKG
jgi:hypothetical protein